MTMPPREALRRAAVWTLVILSIGGAVWIALAGDPSALLQSTGLIVVGALILTSRPGNAVGVILLVAGVLSVPSQVGTLPDVAAALPVGVEVLFLVMGGLSTLAFPLGVLYFPTARVTTRTGRVMVALVGVLAVMLVFVTVADPRPLPSGRTVPWGIPWLAWESDWASGVSDLVWLGTMILAAAALVDLVLRWRRSSGAERLQYRWFAFAVVIILASVVVMLIAGFTPLSLLLYNLGINAIPVAVGIAVTRHGLYEINRVISRTAAYAITTGLVVGVYLTVVTSVTWLLPNAPSIAVAAATLAAAALGLPALRTARRVLDRRFDRGRYDAQRVVEEFGDRLRTEIDPSQTATDLLRAADRTLQPRAAGIWLVSAAEERP